MTDTKSAEQLAGEVKAAFDTRHDQVKAIADDAAQRVEQLRQRGQQRVRNGPVPAADPGSVQRLLQRGLLQQLHIELRGQAQAHTAQAHAARMHAAHFDRFAVMAGHRGTRAQAEGLTLRHLRR